MLRGRADAGEEEGRMTILDAFSIMLLFLVAFTMMAVILKTAPNKYRRFRFILYKYTKGIWAMQEVSP